ncbi:MAG: hypothetical protein JWN76_3148 [Chitinophagaceae bacterium]|nr:hypothetical protein [Chitinophagaceae bacterium]
MRLGDFILLNENDKRSGILHEGILVAKRTTAKEFIFLFQLATFYAEIHCSLADKSVIEYRAFKNTDELAPYLVSIPIDELLQ